MTAFETAAFLVTFAGLLIATYTDLKQRIVEDYISYGMIGLGLLIHLWESLSLHDWSPFYYSLGIAAATFCGGFILWRLGFWAGGDVKLFTGIAALLPFRPLFLTDQIGLAANPAFLPIFPLTVLLFSLFAMFPVGIALAAYRLHQKPAVKNKIIKDLKAQIPTNAYFAVAAAGLVEASQVYLNNSLFAIAGILVFFVLPKKIRPVAAALAFAAGIIANTPEALVSAATTFVVLEALSLVFKLSFSKEIFRTEKQISNLAEGDIVATTIYEKNNEIFVENNPDIQTIIKNLKTQTTSNDRRIICASYNAGGLENNQIQELQILAKQQKIPSTILVKESAPFVPAILAGFVLASVFGELLWKIVMP
ncbi:MAG: prepilin peptidase [Candidatus Diapherotrites archaeon]|uniref:Prepilin peptidase n=1 Tax=Candidatus Iainarchaeum sp. TaxID=3101447 RepID=A0A8T4L6M6_9ARCH|nr:prepilin peptidase [Candidatus Diapherotrites archaeon]